MPCQLLTVSDDSGAHTVIIAALPITKTNLKKKKEKHISNKAANTPPGRYEVTALYINIPGV